MKTFHFIFVNQQITQNFTIQKKSTKDTLRFSKIHEI